MSKNSFTEVSSTSWFSRIGKAFTGILIGLLLVLVGAILLFWNEGRTVERRKALNEGAASVRSITPDKVDTANQGALVHVTGTATTDETLSDPEFGISTQAIRLRRSVEMYQWQEDKKTETEKKVGGGTETTTTYNYKKVWSSSHIDSSSFNYQDGHQNPVDMPLRSQGANATKVTLGAFTLPPSLVSEMDAWESLPVTDAKPNLPNGLNKKLQRIAGGFYIGGSPNSPQIGDLRVFFSVVKPAMVSLYAQQNGDSFAPYETESGGTLERLEMGSKTAAQMFKQAQHENTILMWVLRAVGLILLVVGFSMTLKPISVILDVIPLLGNVAEMGIMLVSLLLGLSLGLVIIAIAWLFYRPLLGIGLLVGAGLLLFGLRRLRTKSSPQVAPPPAGPMTTPPPPPPPPR